VYDGPDISEERAASTLRMSEFFPGLFVRDSAVLKMDEAHFPENSVCNPEAHNVLIPVEKA